MVKKRLDLLVLEKNPSLTREKVKEMIKWGLVEVNGKKNLKPGKPVNISSTIKIIEPLKYVGRAGYKLQKALDYFKIDVKGKVCLDLGSSVGGFVDCLIQGGAKKVYAVEIAKGKLHPSLINNKKVVNMAGIDIRKPFNIPEKASFCSIDLTFVSLKDILLRILPYLKSNYNIVALVKPPFEKKIKGKIKAVRLDADYKEILTNLSKWIKKQGLPLGGIIDSPIEGKSAKQKEFLIYISSNGKSNL